MIPSLDTIKLAAIAVVVLLLFGGGFLFGFKVEQTGRVRDQAKYTQAIDAANEIAAAEQHKIDQVSIASVSAYAREQAALAAEAQREVRYVPTITACVPVGLVRVLRDAAIGVPAAGGAKAARRSDDACSGVKWAALADSIVADFGRARANAIQLNGLIGWYQGIDAK